MNGDKPDSYSVWLCVHICTFLFFFTFQKKCQVWFGVSHCVESVIAMMTFTCGPTVSVQSGGSCSD